MKLSIILTVFNKEVYLRRSLDAILAQDCSPSDNYEIIIVNDGSTDSSGVIVDEYEKRHDCIKVLTQANQGLSAARNNGMDFSHGDYIWFVDADDTIEQDAVKFICEATISKADVLPIYAKTVGKDSVRNTINPKIKTGKEVLLSGNWQHCGVFYIFKKTFLIENKLRFFSGIYHEDSEFTPRMLYMANSIMVIPKILYNVYQVSDSITRVPRSKRAFDSLIVAERLNRFILDNHELETKIGQVLFNEISVIINNAFHVISQNRLRDQEEFDIVFFEKRSVLLQSLERASQIKYNIESVLFRMIPKHYVKVYKYMKFFG